MTSKNKTPYIKHTRFAGKKIRTLAILNIRASKLQQILHSGKKLVKGMEKQITELDMEKFGFQLERCESEILRLTGRQGS